MYLTRAAKSFFENIPIKYCVSEKPNNKQQQKKKKYRRLY